MAKPQKFTTDQILDAAAAASAARWREATIADVAERVGAPVGSIYHRFGSRDELFISLWLRSIRRFHVGLLEAAATEDPHAALLQCAVHVPRFCREHPLDAVALTLYRQADLVTHGPASLRDEVAHINDDAFAALAQRRYRAVTAWHISLVNLAVGENPYGLVRRHLRDGTPIPEWMDGVVLAAASAIFALGDRDTTEV